MLAFVLLFAVAFAQETTVTCDAGKYQKLNDAQDGCVCMEGFTPQTDANTPCVCSEANKHIIKETGDNNAVTYECKACETPNDKYDTTGMRCYKEATCNLPGQKVNMDKCECDDSKNYVANEDTTTATDKPCVCKANHHEETSGTSKTCKADVVCTLPGQQPNENKNACECTVDGFEKDETASTEAELKCKCAEANKYIINKTGTTNVLSYACEVCGEGQTYNAQKMSCETPAPACNLPGQKVNGNPCECDTEKGFTVNTGEDKDTKPCVCGKNGQNIIKETGDNNAVTYKCETCTGETPHYDSTNMKCYKKEQTEEEKCKAVEGQAWKDGKCECDTANGYENKETEATKPMKCEKKAEQTEEEKCKGVKGQEWKDNQCVCDTTNGFENKETGKEKPINCGCKETGHNIIKETKDNTTSYKCAKCEDKEKYDENEMKCIKSGVNGFFLLLAMALFFLF